MRVVRSFLLFSFTIASILWAFSSATTTTTSTTTSVADHNHHRHHENVQLGTTLVAIKYAGGVVIGADCRTSITSYVSHRFAHKITPVTRFVVLGRSGSASETQQLAQVARLNLQRRQYQHPYSSYDPSASSSVGLSSPSVSSVAHWLRHAVVSARSGTTSSSLIVAGFDVSSQQPRIFTLAPTGALLEEQAFAMSGSGAAIITGFLDHEYQQQQQKHQRQHPSPPQYPPKNKNDKNQKSDSAAAAAATVIWDEATAIHLCRTAVSLAIQRDGSSGGGVRVCRIDASGTTEWIFPPTNTVTGTSTTCLATTTTTTSSSSSSLTRTEDRSLQQPTAYPANKIAESRNDVDGRGRVLLSGFAPAVAPVVSEPP